MCSKLKYANTIHSITAPSNFVRAFIFALALVSILLAYNCKDAVSMDLTQFEWKNRLLLVFAPNSNDPHFMLLQREISAKKINKF